MRVNMGVMQMATVVITPREKNLPLLSADYMYILSNRKSYLEFYDVVKEKDSKYNADMNITQMLIDNIKTYMEHSKQLPLLSEAEKNEKLAITVEYTDGLIKKGHLNRIFTVTV